MINVISIPVVILFLSFYEQSNASSMNYVINKLWDNRSIAENDNVNLNFTFVDNIETVNKDLHIKVLAPFYDDPHINDTVPAGSMDKLWEYEVVEVFLLGSDDQYLEIEFAPKGQYLLLQLHGYRNVVKTPLFLDSYSAKIDDKIWSGNYIIPSKYMPPNLSKFNAYAIHGTDPVRQYLALFPTPLGKYENPDFHRLDYFQKFELK